MTPKALAAIAITLILACPVIMGYALASEEVEYTQNVQTGSTSITDALLNSKTDYYLNYTKTNNNDSLLQKVNAQGGTYYTYVAPDYVNVSSNNSSLPVYDISSSSSLIPNTPTTTTISVDRYFPAYSGIVVGSSDALTADWPTMGAVVADTVSADERTVVSMTADPLYPAKIFIDGVADTSYPSTDARAGGIEASDFAAIRNGSDWTFVIGSTQYTGSWAFIGSLSSSTVSYSTLAYSNVSAGSSDWIVNMPYTGGLKLTYSDGSISYMPAKTVSHGLDFFIVDGENVAYPSAVAVSYSAGGAELITYTETFNNRYANPATGWRNPGSTESIYYNSWRNQFQNASVTFYVAFQGDGEVEFDEGLAGDYIIGLNRVNGIITLVDIGGERQTLGTYQYAQVFFNAADDQVTVSGLMSWPAMGAAPELFNSITQDYDFDGYIEDLGIKDNFSTVVPTPADFNVMPGEQVTITWSNTHNPSSSYYLRDENGNTVSSGWTATLSSPTTSTFTAGSSLPTGLYELHIYGAQQVSESKTVYVGQYVFPTSPIAYRVDSASIVAGQFASTKDLTFNPWLLWPNDGIQRIYINSVGVYGDSLTIGGINYPVNNGSITVTDLDTGSEVSLKVLKTTITFELSDGQYKVFVGGHRVATVGVAPTVYFGGEWSLTATRSTMTEETAIKTEWVPGQFALDENGFVLVMILVAAGAFVVLGMTGARSGGKVALLAMICGGAAAIGLIIL